MNKDPGVNGDGHDAPPLDKDKPRDFPTDPALIALSGGSRYLDEIGGRSDLGRIEDRPLPDEPVLDNC
jgi:hypothetical protein